MNDHCTRSKGQGHKVSIRNVSVTKCYNSVTDSHINFKLGRNYRPWRPSMTHYLDRK